MSLSTHIHIFEISPLTVTQPPHHIVLFSWQASLLTAKTLSQCFFQEQNLLAMALKVERAKKVRAGVPGSSRYSQQRYFLFFDAPLCVVLPQVISDSKGCDICSSVILWTGQHYINHSCQMQMQPVTKRDPFSQSSFMSRWEQHVPAWANTEQL